jgi:hypothetical protein
MGKAIKIQESLEKEHEIFKLLTGKNLLKPERRFGPNWSRYPNEYLNAVTGNIAIYPKQIVATFINRDMKKAVDFGHHFVIKQKIKSRTLNYEYWCAPFLGLLAYIILNSNNEELKQLASMVYKEYEQHLQNKILRIGEQIEKSL